MSRSRLDYRHPDRCRIQRQRAHLVGLIAQLPGEFQRPWLEYLATMEARHVAPENRQAVLGSPDTN